MSDPAPQTTNLDGGGGSRSQGPSQLVTSATLIGNPTSGQSQNTTPADTLYAKIKIDSLTEALVRMVYETTHLSPQRDDGSHDCRISKAALAAAREALKL